MKPPPSRIRQRPRIAVQGRRGVEMLPDEEGSTYVRGGAGRALPRVSGTLIFDWRDGDVP